MPVTSLLLHPDGSVDTTPDAWHATADGVVTRAAAGAAPPAGITLTLDGGMLQIGATCRLDVGTKASALLASGGHHVAAATDRGVLIVDATACRAAGVIDAKRTQALAVDDHRLVTLDTSQRFHWYDWADARASGAASIPGWCDSVWVGPEGPAARCDYTWRLLRTGAPATQLPQRADRNIQREGQGWAMKAGKSSTALSAVVGVGDARASAEGDVAVTWNETAGAATRLVHAWDLRTGAALWTASLAGAGTVDVQPGAVAVRDARTTRLYDLADGHLVWTVRVTANGLDAVWIDAEGRSVQPGSAGMPPWTPRLPAAPPQAPAEEEAAKPPVEPIPWTAPTEAPGDPDLGRVPAVLAGEVGPFESCGAKVPSFGPEEHHVPVRKEAPTLVYAGGDDGYRAPQGVDVVYYFPQSREIAALMTATIYADGGLRLATMGDYTGDRSLPFGLQTGQALLISVDCRVLARGGSAEVTDAAVRWAYAGVDRPLPTSVARTVSTTRVAPIADVSMLADGILGWWGRTVSGAIDASGAPLWALDHVQDGVVGDTRHAFYAAGATVREIDPRTGATLRVVPDATSLVAYGAAGLLVHRHDGSALVDPDTLAVRRLFATLPGDARVGADGVHVAWKPGGQELHTCVLPAEGRQVCASAAPADVVVGDVLLSLGADHVLRAASKTGQHRWAIREVYDLEPGTAAFAMIKLGSSSGQYATVDAAGNLLEWLPVDGHPDARGFGTAGRGTLVRWQP